MKAGGGRSAEAQGLVPNAINLLAEELAAHGARHATGEIIYVENDFVWAVHVGFETFQ